MLAIFGVLHANYLGGVGRSCWMNPMAKIFGGGAPQSRRLWTHLRCGEIFNDNFIAALLLYVQQNDFENPNTRILRKL